MDRNKVNFFMLEKTFEGLTFSSLRTSAVVARVSDRQVTPAFLQVGNI